MSAFTKNCNYNLVSTLKAYSTLSRRGDKKLSSVATEGDKKSLLLFTVVYETLVATINI